MAAHQGEPAALHTGRAVTRRGVLQGAGAAGLGLALGGSAALLAPDAASAQTPAASGTLIEGFVGDIGLLAPIVDANRQTLLLFDTLVSQNATTLEPQPNLAAKWTVSDDGLTYTFTLASGVTFHDGQPLTSADVKFTFDLLTNKDTASGYYSIFSPLIASTATPGDATVVVTLSSPAPTFLTNLSAYSIAILPQHLLKDVKPADFAASEFATSKPVGTGPFKLKEYRPGEALLLDPNPSYHRGAPKLAGYVLKILGDTTVAYQQLKTGEVDVAQITADFYDDAKTQTNFAPVVIDTFAINFLAFNQDAAKGVPALRDLAVRQALFYAIDRKLIIDSIDNGLGKVAVGTEPPATNWAYQPDKITQTYAYDPDKAKSLLDGAGYAVGSDGVRAKGSDRLSFTILGNTNPAIQGTILALQEFFKAINVEVTPQFEPQNFFNIYLAKDYQLAYLNFTFPADPDQSLAFSSTSPFDSFGYKNPQVDQLLQEGLATTDTAKRADIYLQIQNILLTDLPVAVLTFDQRVTGVATRVKNYVPTAVGYYWAIAYDAPTWEIAG